MPAQREISHLSDKLGKAISRDDLVIQSAFDLTVEWSQLRVYRVRSKALHIVSGVHEKSFESRLNHFPNQRLKFHSPVEIQRYVTFV